MTTTFLPRIALLVFIASCALAPSALAAHKPDQSYVFLRVYQDSLTGRVEISTEDLNRIVGSALPKNGLTRAQAAPLTSRMQTYLRDHLSFSIDGRPVPYNWSATDILNIYQEGEADVVQYYFVIDGVNDIPENIEVTYDAVLELRDLHRGVLIIEQNWKGGVVDNHTSINHIFTPDDRSTALDLTDVSVWKGVWALIKLGVWHIWIGLDHILFIVALILPSVVRRDPHETQAYGVSKWRPVPAFRPAFFYLVKIVTFFTIAHSITLALASTGLVTLPSKYVEATIAFSIGLAAFHNIHPIFRGKEWVIAFVFGLFHGFGFASVLGEKGLGSDFLAYSLFGFNVGVEIGQLLIICTVFPVLFVLRKTKFYQWLIIIGSALLILIAVYWTVERLFEVDITPLAWVRNLLGLARVG